MQFFNNFNYIVTPIQIGVKLMKSIINLEEDLVLGDRIGFIILGPTSLSPCQDICTRSILYKYSRIFLCWHLQELLNMHGSVSPPLIVSGAISLKSMHWITLTLSHRHECGRQSITESCKLVCGLPQVMPIMEEIGNGEITGRSRSMQNINPTYHPNPLDICLPSSMVLQNFYICVFVFNPK